MEDRLFRDAMGKFATGVTVVTTQFENESFGMTANAFMSVSLDPKLVVISIGHKARFLTKVQESKKFAVNILAADQKEYSMAFAGQLKEEITINFEDLAGLPVLPGALAQVSCEVISEHVEGDHTLFIGKVLDIKVTDGEPLVFYAGKYRELVQSEIKTV
ncbi:flavin reductase family protein [Ureibacillus chungkukjangi]|uniref:Flavin reductase (DIM6/NTAB) family NADH-FMN oxidoreductase RutF n=1 Tax=Ureibacillus chungkukjangi TaxID=1202712 RepID=A0A318U1H1_9BACL|nr:flavin reductase family protein [Ureibacillus chungkukjangi]MCM3388949.1 flavin reductase family protein [Ureibacillus chungkukjangi]PYF05789.1 flavin reductase (DIM6/NTAB) family NADH-FMN oxidoreductase RutF [Ureibacillus chungkukjangi]